MIKNSKSLMDKLKNIAEQNKITTKSTQIISLQ